MAQTTINGNALALRSTGSSSGTAWNLDRDGYVGTYITVPAGGANVTIDVQAQGTPDSGIDPNMNVVIADTKASFDVPAGLNTYSHTYSLPGGTYILRTELNNDVGAGPRQLTVNNITVTGATVSNSSTSANALAAADSYVANYRQGPATIAMTGVRPGMPVGVNLSRIAFNFGNSVPGTSTSSVNAYLGSYNNPAGQTAQQANYQAHLNQNFNAVTEENAGKWASDEPAPGNVTMGGVDAILSYAQAHGMYARMHNLIWGSQQPSWVLNGTSGLLDQAAAGNMTAAATLRSAITSRINYYLGDGPGGNVDRSTMFGEVDIYNESYHTGSNAGASSHNYWNVYGVNGIAGIYNEAKQAIANSGSSAKVYTNEYSVLEDGNYSNFYVQNIEAIRNAGINQGFGDVLGGIGTEYYPNSSDNAANFARNLQNLDVQGLPLTLTEFGVQSPATTVQAANILSDALRLYFGNPNSTGFFMWGFQAENGGGNLFAPQAALYTVNTSDWTNWTITNAGKVWQEQLGIQNWGLGLTPWTTHLTTAVDANDQVNFTGYYGNYQISVGVYKGTLSLVKGTTNYALNINLGAGDYNFDGVVNAADYTIWRDTLGSTTDLRADGNGDGVIDQADYDLWASKFGTVYVASGAGAGSNGAVPEPASIGLALMAALATVIVRRLSKKCT
jgi:GH35 family endo-1,4-beta-xylanase